MPTITSANAVLMLGIPSLYNAPQQLQGFAADDIYDIDPLQTAETVMGVDGNLSAGFVYVEIKQKISIQADSISNVVFDTWYQAQQQISDLYFATGSVVLTGINRKFSMNRGVLTMYPPIPNAKRILQPRVYEITWESITLALNGGTSY